MNIEVEGRKLRVFSLMDQLKSERKLEQSKNPERCNAFVPLLPEVAHFSVAW